MPSDRLEQVVNARIGVVLKEVLWAAIKHGGEVQKQINTQSG